MRVVAIPFLDEDPSVVQRNLGIAASHPAVDQVWAVHKGRLPDVLAPGQKISFLEQERIGRYREGKGDAMNTALALAAQSDVERLHFYDADITNFDHGWIDGAERAAGLGYEVVRHTFPRAATDAMITWLITKPVLAMKYPGTVLPRIGQPLGGELALSRPAIEDLSSSPEVSARSDWGIDTLLTFTSVATGHSLFEHHVDDGKRHALYGSLAELRTMLIECFDAVASLPQIEIPPVAHAADAPTPAPEDLRQATGYSVESTMPLLTQPVSPAESHAAATLPGDLEEIHRLVSTNGSFNLLDEARWEQVLQHMVSAFQAADPGWEALLFRLWVGRVLHYTVNEASVGYDHALSYLMRTVESYEAHATDRPSE